MSLTVQPGEHLAVTGANGSGKTTLMLVLSGREPTAGTMERPGAVGLGRLGGTAVVMQHPESQVLGTRVADDVVWGLPPGTATDVSRLLAEVGLDGLADRDTGGLSGGELQRLAVAAALAREPSLLIADEVTSMVDQEGREGLMSVLSGSDPAPPHVAGAHHALQRRGRRRRPHRQPHRQRRGQHRDGRDHRAGAVGHGGRRPPRGAPVLELNGVSHEYGSGTPWAKTALTRYRFRGARGRRRADPRPQRVGQVDAGLDHGRA